MVHKNIKQQIQKLLAGEKFHSVTVHGIHEAGITLSYFI